MPANSPRNAPSGRTSGLARRMLGSVASPAIFDFWAAHVSRTWTWERPLARVLAVRPAARDAVTLVLKPNRHWRGCVAGQHVNIGVEIDGRRMTRAYSPSAAPQADGTLEITVKAMPGGRMSQHLCRNVRAGDVLDVGPAFGAMRLPDTASVPVLLLAAGSGITPLMAMLREGIVQQRRAPIALLVWAKTREEFCFVDELRALVAQHAHIDVRFILTGESAAAPDEAEGRLQPAHVAPWCHHSTHVYACGPDGFVEHARAVIGVQAAAFSAEAFTLPQTRLPHAADEQGTVDITLARSGRTLQLPRGVNLLSALEANGVRPPSGCRMGICNTCACGKASGTTRELRTGALESEPVSALRLCVHAATTHLVLDL